MEKMAGLTNQFECNIEYLIKRMMVAVTITKPTETQWRANKFSC